MADLEAVLADVSYLMAMEKSKCTPAARASKKIILPDPRYVQIMLAHFGKILRDLMLKRQLSFMPMHHFCKKPNFLLQYS
jgi:beta-adrenergic-receptor kinase